MTTTSKAVVEQTAGQWPVFKIYLAAHAYPFRSSNEDMTDLGAFTVATSVDGRVREWAETFLLRRPTDTLVAWH